MDYKYRGDCHHIAAALSRLTGHRIVFFYGERIEEDGYVEQVMVHCGVEVEGEFMDFCGRSGLSLEDAFEEFAYGNDPYESEDIFRFSDENCSEFKSLAAECGASFDAKRVDYFYSKILKQKKKYI